MGGCKEKVKEVIARISSEFMLVRKKNLKSIGAKSIKSTSICNFEIVKSEEVANRIPKILPKAVCKDENCELFCRPVSIERIVFKKKQDKDFGIYYSQSIVEEVIGFVQES